MKTPFTEANIVSSQTVRMEYEHEPAERGDPRYTIRSHCLAEILRNAHRWVQGYVSPESKAKEFGDLLDCLVLTPADWHRTYVVRPETYPAPADHRDVKAGNIREGDPLPWNGNAKVCKAWLKEHAGLKPISDEMDTGVHAAMKSIYLDTDCKSILEGASTQVWIAGRYEDAVTGIKVPVKALIDIVPHPDSALYGESLWDLKTTRNAAPRRFARDTFEYGYYIQAAWYLDLWNAATGEERQDFGHIICENYPPYESRMPWLSQKFLGIGRFAYLRALELYCRCLETGKWPAYDPPGTPITESEDWMLDPSNFIRTAMITEDEESTLKESEDVPV